MDPLASSVYDERLPPEAIRLALALLVIDVITCFLNIYALSICIFNEGFLKIMSIRLALLIVLDETVKVAVNIVGLVLLLKDGSYASMQYTGCQVYGAASVICFACCGIALLNIAIERFLLIKGVQPTLQQLLIMNATGLFFAALIAVTFPVFGTGMEIQPSKMYCMANWASKATGDLVGNVLAMSTLWGGLVLLGTLQYAVYKSSVKSKQAVERVNRPTKSGRVTPIAGYIKDDNQQRTPLRLRFYTLTFAAALGWLPFGIQSTYTIATQRPPPFWADAATVTMMACSSLALIVLQIAFTPLLKQVAVEHMSAAWARIPAPVSQALRRTATPRPGEHAAARGGITMTIGGSAYSLGDQAGSRGPLRPGRADKSSQHHLPRPGAITGETSSYFPSLAQATTSSQVGARSAEIGTRSTEFLTHYYQDRGRMANP